jgi:hypothetical protein
MLMDGKHIAALKVEGEEDGPQPEMDEEENAVSYGAVNDASVRIAQLQSQLDKERDQSRMMKENYEADIGALERKLNNGMAKENESEPAKVANAD